MNLSSRQISRLKKWLNDLSSAISQKNRHCFLYADPTRLKILLLLKQQSPVCVSDLSEILGLSVSAISHQLSNLEKMEVVISEKKGKNVCCRLSDQTQIVRCLKDFSKK